MRLFCRIWIKGVQQRPILTTILPGDQCCEVLIARLLSTHKLGLSMQHYNSRFGVQKGANPHGMWCRCSSR